MRRTAIVTVSFAFVIVFSLVGSASALYLEYHYFETDKIVYEVGETIDMVARLIANFDDGGWAYVSFGVITDQGPVFSDEYFISPSPSVRYLTSSYQIHPDDTMPGENGSFASVIFNIEVFEGFSQVAGDTVVVNITRGHLEAVPLTSLSMEHGTNTILRILVSSIHNSTIVLPDSPISISITNNTHHTVFENTTFTNQNGVLSVPWKEEWGPPGEYNLSLHSNETQFFHTLSESLTVTVTPPSSALTVTSFPNTVYCQTPDGSHTESIDIEVKHDNDGQPIDGSLVEWQTTFSSGSLTPQGSGQYRGFIPFTVDPGAHTVNLSASNDNYMTAYTQQTIDVIHRESNITIAMNDISLSGQDMTIDITVTDLILNSGVGSTPVSLSLKIGSSEFTTQGVTNSSGQFKWVFHIPSDIWGNGSASVIANNTTHYTETQQSAPFSVMYEPNVGHDIINPLVLGETADIRITVSNPDLQAIDSLSIELRNSSGNLLVTGILDSSGQTTLTWTVLPSSQLGLQDFTLLIIGNSLRHIANTTTIIQLSTYHPLYLVPSHFSWTTLRGENITLSYRLDSHWAGTQPIDILFNDTRGEILLPLTNMTNQQINTTINIGNNISLGTHHLIVQINSSLFMPLGIFEMNLTIIGSLSSIVSPGMAYYGEGFEVSLEITDDVNATPDCITIRAMIGSAQTMFAFLSNTTPESVNNISLPTWVTPGMHSVTLEISGAYLLTTNSTFDLMVWMQTQLTITLTNIDRGNETGPSPSPHPVSQSQDPIISTISSGRIMSPPPILCNGTISTDPPTTRETSLESCPKFISGTNNLSTVLAKLLIASSGNGHRVLIRNDLKETESSVIASSTDLEVQPNETTPQEAFEGPSITKSAKKLLASRIFAVIR